MESTDPHEGETYTFKSVTADGEIIETEMTAGQVLDIGAGKPVAYCPQDEQVLVDGDGTIVRRDSAVPRTLPEGR